MATPVGEGARIPPEKKPLGSPAKKFKAEIESSEVDEKSMAEIKSDDEKSKAEIESEDETGEEYCGCRDNSSSEDEDLEEVDGLRLMNKKESREYFNSLRKSGGYDVVNFPGVYMYGGIQALDSDYVKSNEKFKRYANFAIEETNKNKNTNYELAEVMKVNFEGVAGRLYYITSKVKEVSDAAYHVSHLKCRAKVWQKLDQSLELVDFQVERFQ